MRATRSAAASTATRAGVLLGTGIGGCRHAGGADRGTRRARRPAGLPVHDPDGDGQRRGRDAVHAGRLAGPVRDGDHRLRRRHPRDRRPAARLIAAGRADVMLAGGAESSITPTTVAGFTNMTALSRSGVSRPFDSEPGRLLPGRGRRGAGAGGARARARAGRHRLGDGRGDRLHRRRPPHHRAGPGRLGAPGPACGWHSPTPGLSPGDIVHVNAHGTSTPLNDAAEAAAIAAVLGPHGPPVTSIKGVTGHSLGAAGALEAVAVLLCRSPPGRSRRRPG